MACPNRTRVGPGFGEQLAGRGHVGRAQHGELGGEHVESNGDDAPRRSTTASTCRGTGDTDRRAPRVAPVARAHSAPKITATAPVTTASGF